MISLRFVMHRHIMGSVDVKIIKSLLKIKLALHRKAVNLNDNLISLKDYDHYLNDIHVNA